MTRSAPAWLADFQARFGAVIRTPLDRSRGTLSAQPLAYDSRIVESAHGRSDGGAGRLAVYNRQYWFRLFDILQSAFPLTARLLGYWSFNDYAARFVSVRAPRGWNIDDIPSGFDVFFDDVLECTDASRRKALVESARIDMAWREAFAAPSTPPFRPSDVDASRLLDAHLLPSPSVRIVEEHWPLVDLRRALPREPGTVSIELPPLLRRSRWWAIVGTGDGVAAMPLEPREAELLVLLGQRSVRAALSQLEHACSDEERARLPERARVWLARSVACSFWSGARFEP
jgi:hypothetical protein